MCAALGLVNLQRFFRMEQAFLGFPYLNTVYWTLTVELLFYLLYIALVAMGWHDQVLPVTVLLLLVSNIVEVVAPNCLSGHRFSHE